MRKLYLLLMGVVFFAMQANAQRTITGKVTDEKGNPIVAKVNDTEPREIAAKGTITDNDQPTTPQPKSETKPSSSSARNTAFQAYGVDPYSQDPVTEAFAKMLEHIQQSETRLDQLQAAMCKLDPDFCVKQYDKLCLEDIDVIDQEDMNTADATKK